MQYFRFALLAVSATALSVPRQASELSSLPVVGGLTNAASPVTEALPAAEPAVESLAPIAAPVAAPAVDAAPAAIAEPVAVSPVAQKPLMTTSEGASKCGNGEVLSCCSHGNANSDGSLLGNVAQSILGGNCDMVPVNIIGANGILMDACHGNTPACCTGDNNGLANVGCIPIPI